MEMNPGDIISLEWNMIRVMQFAASVQFKCP